MAKLKYVQEHLLDSLPDDGSKVAIALDGWSAPYTRQGFIAVLAYWIDKKWILHKALLAFDPIYDEHTGTRIAAILDNVIKTHNLSHRIQAFTTDNASNNGTMFEELGQLIKDRNDDLGLDSADDPELIPCLSHVIQLAIGDLLGKIKINPTNEMLQANWEENEEQESFQSTRRRYQSETDPIPLTLLKVSIYNNHYHRRLLISFSSSESFQYSSIRARIERNALHKSRAKSLKKRKGVRGWQKEKEVLLRRTVIRTRM